MRKVEVVAPRPEWVGLFAAESEHLRGIFGREVVAIHHIGSTAIQGIYAKPVIDILLVVKDIRKVDDFNRGMIDLGYEPMGEFGIPGRRFFRREVAGIRTHHVHTFQAGDAQIDRHLNFRDYMNSHPQEAKAYSQLKQSLALQFPADIEGYMDGKDAFIKDIDRQAAIWRESQRRDE
jgi:GrpB-like predicted nucleotidyltransferase (UPF0157 family)